jgi:uncharacterized protein YfaS (alpha-2-macroglobulin family)
MRKAGKLIRCLSLTILCLLPALLAAASAQEPSYLFGGGSFAPGEEVTLSAYLGSGNTEMITLYRVSNPHRVIDLGGPRDFAGTSELELSELLSFEVSKAPDDYSTDVNLGELPTGLYFAQLGSGATAAATLLLVTDLALVVKSDSDTVLTFTADLATGKPRDAEVWLLEGTSVRAESHTDARGLAGFDADLSDDRTRNIAVRSGDSWAFSGVWWQSWAQEEAKVYVVTDRPVYRPGDEVSFKVTARAAGSLEPLEDKTAVVVVTDPEARELLRQEYTTDSFGSFDGTLRLDAAATLGYYSVEVTVDGRMYWGSWEVLEYRKPEYEVTVSSTQDELIQGGSAGFTIDAAYLFGGPVAGGSVTYAVLRQPYYRYAYRSAFAFYDDAPYYGGDLIQRGEGTLDADGQLKVSIDLPETDFDYQLTLQVGVSDDSNHEVSSSATVTAYRANLVLGLSPDRFAYREGEDVRINVHAEDLAGNPVSLPFTLTTERYYWVEGKGRQVEPGETLAGVTDSRGAGQITLSFEKQGSWGISVKAADTEGRLTSSDSEIWVHGGARWYWNYQDLSVEPDKAEYQVGDTARFVIQSPVSDGVALITREGEQLGEHQLVSFEGSVLTHEITVSEADLPNSYLGVVIVGNGHIYSNTAEYRVPPLDRFLNVEVTSDSAVYQPGTSAQFTVHVTDQRGAGVAAQLTVGLVDDAIYLIRPDNTTDIRGFFYALRGNVVGTDLSSFAYFGAARPLTGRAPLDSAVFAQSKAQQQALAAARLREDFRDTILWLPDVETAADGTTVITVDFPDNLTRWRMTARAITQHNQVGQGTHEVTTTLPVIARLAVPRFLVRGDTASLRVIGQSNLEQDVQARMSITATGLELEESGSTRRELPAHGSTTADYRVTATETGTASVTGEVLTDVFSDAMRLPLPVLPHGIQRELTHSASGSDTWTLQVPGSTVPDTLRGEVYLTPSLVAAVTPALAWLADYPYGGPEQTMNRFLPALLAARAGYGDWLPEEIAADPDTFVRLGLNRLYEFQHADGGWGFWQFDTSSPFISAYVTTGLLEARDAGYDINQWVLDRALDYLEGASVKDTYQIHDGLDVARRRAADADAKAFAYYALARAGRNIDALAAVAGRREMSSYGLALSVLAFATAGRDVEARFHLDQLTARVIEQDATAWWPSGAPRYTWSDDEVQTTALALEALALLTPESPLITKVSNWLLLERRGAHWVSTKDTAAVVRAALALEQARPGLEGSQSVTVRLNGMSLGEYEISSESRGFSVSLDGLQPGTNVLELAAPPGSTLHSSVSVTFTAEADFLEAEDRGIGVHRSYELLTPHFDAAQQRVLYERSPLGSAMVGDYVLVTVTLEPDADLSFVLVNEPLPAGFSVIEDDYAFRVGGVTTRYGPDYYGWNYWYDGRQIHDSSIDYYFSRIRRPVTFTYILRAETPGEFTALPGHAWLLYAPDLEGRTSRDRLGIVPAVPAPAQPEGNR